MMIEIDVNLSINEIKTKKKIKYGRIFSCCFIPLIIFSGILYFLFIQYQNYIRINQAKTQAYIQQTLQDKKKGVNIPSSDEGDPLEKYSVQANAVVSYDKTHWQPINDVLFKYAMFYPDNTSGLVRNAQGDQLWFLRRTGYMFKMNMYKNTYKTLDDFYNTLPDKAKYDSIKSTLGKEKALFLKQKDLTQPIIANEYILTNKEYIFVLWYQIYQDTGYTDDNKRIENMLNSFHFLKD